MVHGILDGRIKLFLCVGAVNILCLATGMMLSWSSPVLEKLNSNSTDNPLPSVISDDDSSWIGSLLALGASIGPFPFGFLQDKVGRKITLLVVAVPYIVAYFMEAFARHVAVIFAARALAGLSVGGVFTVVPTYIAEVSDVAVRGMMGTSMNNFLSIGLILSYTIGPYISIMWFSILSAIFPVIFMILCFMFVPDSPYYLIGEGKKNEAESALAFIRSKNKDDVQAELKEIEESVNNAKQNAGTFLDIFKTRGTTKALIISVMLAVFQQLSGINVILFYTQTIFQASGASLSAELPPMILGAVQLTASFATPLLVDRLGRKMLFMISGLGMAIAEIPLGVYFQLKDDGVNVDAISFLPVVTLVLYIIFYNFGFGPLPWTIMAELFPSNIKSVASSFTAFCCWFVSFLLTYFFSRVADAIGLGGSFWIFAGCSILAFLFTLIYVPETKGKSFQEIQNVLNS